jgi:hypothetical protein
MRNFTTSIEFYIGVSMVVFTTSSADRPVMKSAWSQGGGGSSERDNRHLSAAELHDPRGIGMHQAYRRPEEIEADVVRREKWNGCCLSNQDEMEKVVSGHLISFGLKFASRTFHSFVVVPSFFLFQGGEAQAP